LIASDTMPGVSPARICGMADSYQGFQVLSTAVGYDIFTVLSVESKSAGEIAHEIGTDPCITEKLLNALVSTGLLAKGSGKYANTPLAESFLVKGEPFYQGNYIGLAKTVSFGTSPYDDWAKIGEALETGYVQPDDHGDMSRLLDKSFSMTMKEVAMRGEVQATAEVVSGYAWFRDARELLDLGGTHGLYAIAFADKNPKLRATLFDFPGVPALGNAEEHIEGYGMTGRVTIQEGDFMGGDIGSGYDAVFISHVYLQEDVLDSVLRRIHDALNCDGRFVLKNCVIPKNRKGSFVAALYDLDMCFWSDEHRMQSIDEYVDLIEPYGFVIEDVAKIGECSYTPSAIIIFKKEA